MTCLTTAPASEAKSDLQDPGRAATFEGITRLAVTPGSILQFSEEPDEALEQLATELTVEGIEARVIWQVPTVTEDTIGDLVLIYLGSHFDPRTNDTFGYVVEQVMGIARRWAKAHMRKRAGESAALADQGRSTAEARLGAPIPGPPAEPDANTFGVDAVEHMAGVRHRAMGWLAETNDIDAVRDAKATFVCYEALIRENKLAFDAKLSATECVRRCERRIGELVKLGQEVGTIRSKSHNRPRPTVHRGTIDGRARASDYIPGGGKGYAEHRAMAGADDEQFEQAVEEAKAEGNLSRANVVRKLKGDDRPTPKLHDVQHEQPLESVYPPPIVVEFRRLDGSLVEGLEVAEGPDRLVAVSIVLADPGAPSRRPSQELFAWLDADKHRKRTPRSSA
jgi:hypothetical protein